MNSLSRGVGAFIPVWQAVVNIITCIFNSLVASLVAFVRGVLVAGHQMELVGLEVCANAVRWSE